MAEITVTEKNFKAEVLQSDLPVLVDFWAPWCGPCKMLGPVVEKLAELYEGKAKICKINVDDEQALAMRYQIASIPTVMIFKNGEAVDKAIGYRSLNQLEDMLK